MRRFYRLAVIGLVCLGMFLPALGWSIGLAQGEETLTPESTSTAGETASPAPETVPPPTQDETAPPATLTPEATTPVPPAETAPPPAGLQVTGVEPGRLFSETGGPLSIYGTGFLSGTAVRLVGYGLLDSTVLNATAIRVVVPPGLKKGSYSLSVILPDGEVAYIENAFRIVPVKDPTPTATASGRSSVFAQPQIVIEKASTEPEILRPGAPFTLSFQVVNQGGYTAANVRVSLGASSLAVPREGSSLWIVNQLPAKGSAALRLPLALVSSAPAGYGSLELVIEYYDYLGQPYKSSQNIGLRVESNLSTQPRVLLSAYRTEPDALSPGDSFLLSLELTNVGKSATEQVLVTLGGEEGTGIKPFAILGASNVKFFPRLAGGETQRVEHRLILDGAAESGVYNLPVSLSYDDLNGERRTENLVINLLVNRLPKLEVDFYRPVDPGLVGAPLALPIELVNIGRNMVNISTVEISGEALEITTGSAYIGALDGGTAGTLDAEVIPQHGGSLPVLVSIHYLDDFNQPQVFTHTLTVQVNEPEAPEGEGAQASQTEEQSLGDRILRFLRGLFGLGS